MNGLSKGMQKAGLATTYQQGVKEALTCELLLIGFQYPVTSEELLLRKLRINELELVLQRFLKPVLTARAPRYTGDEILNSLLPTNTP